MTKRSAIARRQENQRRQTVKRHPASAGVRRKSALDQLSDWLARRSRPIRALLAALVAAAIIVSLTIVVSTLLLSIDPRKIRLGPINADNISTVLLLFLAILGIVLYWVGWRVFIGFDFSEIPMRPGRAASLWLLFGIAMLIGTVIVAIISTLQATAPI